MTYVKRTAIMSFILGIMASSAVLAQSETASSIKLDEIVVTGTGTNNKLKYSPVAVEVISGKEISNVNSPTLESLLTTLAPSLSFTPNAMGSNLRLNGLSNRYVLILVNGKRLAGDVSGNIDLSRINISNIQHIEVLKGAASSLYGSEAIGGVINIITQKPQESISIHSDSRYAEWGQFSQSVTANINSRWIESNTSYQRKQSGGWQLNPQEINKKGNLVDTYKHPVNPYYSDILTQNFTINANEKLSMYVEGSIFDRKLKRSTDYKYNLYYKDYTIGAGGKYNTRNNGLITLDMFTDNFDYYKEHTVDGKSNKAGDKVRERRQKYYDANLKGVFHAGQSNRITLGSQYQVNYLNSRSDIADGSRDVYTLSLYAQDEIRLLEGKLQIVPGFRYVYNETFKNHFTPKLATMYSTGHFNFRLSYASGFKAPDLKYLFSNTESKAAQGKTSMVLSNKELKPETSDYYSMNVEYFNSFMSASVSGYINKVNNLIKRVDVDPVPDEYLGQYDNIKQYDNASKVTMKGIDANFNAYFGKEVSLNLGYGYVHSEDHDTGKELEKVSKHTGTVGLNWNKQWIKGVSNINFNGRLQSKPYFVEEDGRSVNLWNIYARHQFKACQGLQFEPGIGIENLFNFVDDRPYGVNYATLSPGRTLFVSLSIHFTK